MMIDVFDVEKADEETLFIRINLLPDDCKKLNELLNSHVDVSEWITAVLKHGGIEKIVVYSEKDDKEYDITNLYTVTEEEAIIESALKLLEKEAK